MDLEFKIIRGIEEFNAIKPKYLAFFDRIFKRPYPISLWNHYYQDNPCGSAQGVSVWHQNEFVGLGCLLPQELLDRKNGKLIPYGLHVTVLIDDRHSHGGWTYFQIQEHLARLARESGFTFIIGFPNANAFLPLTRLGGFDVIDTARFVRSHGGLGHYVKFLEKETDKIFFSDRCWKWRLQRFPYKIQKGCVTKVFQGTLNLLDWLEINKDHDLTGVFPFWSSAGDCPLEAVDDYIIRLCYRPIDKTFNITQIKKSVMYSDVY